MRTALLLIIMFQTLWIGLEFKQIADHYEYIENACMLIFKGVR